MTPMMATHKQIEHYQRMTGEQRVAIALGLHELSCNVAREGIRRQNRNVDEAEVEHLLRWRIELANSEKQIAELAIANKLICQPQTKLRW